MPETGPLIDRHGRVHSDLRISVTDRCNIRCFYCMPEEGGAFAPNSQLIGFPQLVRAAKIGVGLGIRKIRLTGGEPLLRPRLADLISQLSALPAQRLGINNQRVALGAASQELRQAGLRRLNIHLDSLDRERFHRIARRDELARVLAGIDAAAAEGFDFKLNAVAVKNLSEPDLVPLVRFARERGVEIRFIEFMPLDGQSLWDGAQVLTADEMIDILEAEFGPLAANRRSGPTRARHGIRVCGRFTGRLHRVGEPSVLPELQPIAPYLRRQAPQLSVCPRGNRYPPCPPVRLRRGT